MMKFCRSVLKIFIIFFFLLSVSPDSSLFAYNFSNDADKLSEDMRTQGISSNSVKMAIVFNVADQSNLRQRTNLVQLKKDLTYAISKLYNVADPAVTGEIIGRNNLNPTEIKKNQVIRSEFAKRNEATYILIVDIIPDSETLTINFDTISSMGVPVSQFSSTHPIENRKPGTVTQSQPIANSAYASFGSGFSDYFPLGVYNRLSNDTWFYFQQSAMLIAQTHSLELVLWLKDIEKVELPLKLIRYDLRYERFQFGIQGYWEEDKYEKKNILHSTYASIKANLIDDQMFHFPFYLALGFKRNITWHDDNPDFKYKDNKKTEEDNKDKNLNTLFGALTFRLDDIGLIINTYYDNVYFTLGSKMILHNNIRLLFDYQLRHITTDYEKSDFGIFLELLSTENLMFYLGYQQVPEQTLFGFKLAIF